MPSANLRTILVLLACLGPATRTEVTASETNRLVEGEEVVFCRPQPIPNLPPEVAVQYGAAPKTGELREAADRLLQQPEFVRAVRDYHRILGASGRGPVPLYIGLHETLPGVSYTLAQPFLLEEGRGQWTPHFAPVVILSPETLREVRQGESIGTETACHEVGHAQMLAATGVLGYPPSWGEDIASFLLGEGHWFGKTTSPSFALSEGWAEYVAAHYMGHPISARLLQQKVAGKTRPRTGRGIRATEGAVAYLLWKVENDGVVPDAFDLYLEVLREDHPKDVDAVFRGVAARRPAEAEKLRNELSRATDGRYEPAPPPDARERGRRLRNEVFRVADALLDRIENAVRGAGPSGPPLAPTPDRPDSHPCGRPGVDTTPW